MFNLNKKELTKKELLKHISPEQIFSFYSQEDITLKRVIKSPLRKESNPSFGYFLNEDGEMCFNDFVLGGGDCIKFIELLYGLNHFEALSRIVIDFNLQNIFYHKELDDNTSKTTSDLKIQIKNKNTTVINKKRRDWKKHDIEFWKQFGITISTLINYRVEPIEYFFLNDNPFLADKYSYVFIENKDNKETYKIYQPYSKTTKWLSNNDVSVWQGWEQAMKSNSEDLFITSSLKDVMSLKDCLNLTALSLQSEGATPKEQVISTLQNKFENIYILYDNDFDKETNWGQLHAKRLFEKYNFNNLIIPSQFKSKDFSDLVKNYGVDKAREIFYCNVWLPF